MLQLCCYLFLLWEDGRISIISQKNNIFHLFWALYYNLIINNATFIRYLKTNLKFIEFIVITWSIIVGITIFIPGCYSTADTWGDYKYFFSIISEGGSRLGSDAVMIIALILILIIFDSAKITKCVFLIVPMYTVIMCGSRLYLFFGMIEMLICLYFVISNEKKFILISIPTCLALIFVSLVTSLGAKIAAKQYTSSSVHNKYDTISSGRFSPILRGVKAFYDSNLFNKIFGNGFAFIEEVTHNWVFNDFIEIGLIYGLVGLLCYLYIMRKSLLHMSKSSISFYMKVTVVCTWLVAAFFALFYRTVAYTIAFFITVAILGYSNRKE